MISEYCSSRSQQLVDKLNGKLKDVVSNFESLRLKISPNKLENQSPSQTAVYEEEKEMMIDTSTAVQQ